TSRTCPPRSWPNAPRRWAAEPGASGHPPLADPSDRWCRAADGQPADLLSALLPPHRPERCGSEACPGTPAPWRRSSGWSPSAGLCAPSPEAGGVETNGRFPCRGACRCHFRGCCLVVRGVDDPSVKGPVMRVFVAGATGAIGRQLVPRLVAAGHEVHGMTRSESKQAMLGELGAVPVVADALDPGQVAQAVARARPEVIVHQLTAIGSLDPRHFDRDFAPANRLRTEGTDHLLSAGQAVGVRRVRGPRD